MKSWHAAVRRLKQLGMTEELLDVHMQYAHRLWNAGKLIDGTRAAIDRRQLFLPLDDN
jgi:hypothetical protein